ncbi:MAG: DNA primase [Pseudomonadota bacterium]
MPRFSPDFLDELKSRLRPSDVVGRSVKLKKQGNEYAGLSPFTKEKTPSFFVNDQKGFYHCFSSGKHGDVISFLQETQGLSFLEAVTILAEEAGLPLPKSDPGDERREKVRLGLVDACTAAASFFRRCLDRQEGQEALSYLHRRGVSAEQIQQFMIGFAPASRTALKDHLLNKDFDEAVLIEAGLLIKPEDGGASYDRFRNRIMFPIAGLKSEVIAFGGRALDPDAKAKYLNSPETPLFHKGSVLYNYGEARKAAHADKSTLVVCEGYMDVVALWGAGVRSAVAPLGTALTENQLGLLWRVNDEPFLCFDGDKAGLRAAYRSIDRALPKLEPGKSLRFVFLPEGQDPDDLIKAEGREAFDGALGDAKSLVDVLWTRETSSQRLDTPERRAALTAGLRDLVKTIANKDVRNAYAAELMARLRGQVMPGPRPGAISTPGGGTQSSGGRRSQTAPGGMRGAGFTPWRRYNSDHERLLDLARPVTVGTSGRATSAWIREATLVVAAINHPGLLERQETAFLDLVLGDTKLNTLLNEVLALILADPTLDSAGLNDHLQGSGSAGTLERILHHETLNRQSFLRPEADLEEVEQGWIDALRHHLIATEAVRDLADTASETFEVGENIWKAAVTAREELVNAGSCTTQEASAKDDGVSSGELSDRLEQMRKNVRARRR